MCAERILKSESIENGLSISVGRGFKLCLTRQHDDTGFETYIIENTARKESLRIPRFIFELFRAELRRVCQATGFRDAAVDFKGKVKFRIESTQPGVKIIALDGREGAAGMLLLTHDAAKGLDHLLHDPRVNHGSDVLGRILAYHRLFKFTFARWHV